MAQTTSEYRSGGLDERIPGLPACAACASRFGHGFSPNVKDIFSRFKLEAQIDRLSNADLLYLVTEKFSKIDLHPDKVSNADMGTIFEELIRKFAELSNETAGEHFTPREVIRLMVNLIFAEDDDVLSKPGVVRTIYDPTAGTGGMLSVAGEWVHKHNPKARLTVSGQELNDESYAICKADMLIKGQHVANIKPGDTLANDGHAHQVFDYMLSNPPFGVEWKQSEKAVRKEYEEQGFNDMYRRLDAVSLELDTLGLRHLAQQDVALRALTENKDTKDLKIFTSVLEPASFGERYHQHHASQLDALDQSSDAVRPDPPARYEFERLVKAYLSAPQHDSSDQHLLEAKFRALLACAPAVLQEVSLSPNLHLREIQKRAQQLPELAKLGVQATEALASGRAMSPEWLIHAGNGRGSLSTRAQKETAAGCYCARGQDSREPRRGRAASINQPAWAGLPCVLTALAD
jgi:hypothetical protein